MLFEEFPHSVTDAQCRFTFSEELLQVLCHTKETHFKHLLTGDELWFDYEYIHGSAWALSTANLPTRGAQKIQTKIHAVHSPDAAPSDLFLFGYL
jgi:hypothetical protein